MQNSGEAFLVMWQLLAQAVPKPASGTQPRNIAKASGLVN